MHVRDRELIRRRKQPASLQGDGMERAIGQLVAVSVGPLKEQLAVRDDAVDPLMSGGEDEIPCWDTVQSTVQPGRRGDVGAGPLCRSKKSGSRDVEIMPASKS